MGHLGKKAALPPIGCHVKCQYDHFYFILLYFILSCLVALGSLFFLMKDRKRGDPEERKSEKKLGGVKEGKL